MFRKTSQFWKIYVPTSKNKELIHILIILNYNGMRSFFKKGFENSFSRMILFRTRPLTTLR